MKRNLLIDHLHLHGGLAGDFEGHLEIHLLRGGVEDGSGNAVEVGAEVGGSWRDAGGRSEDSGRRQIVAE